MCGKNGSRTTIVEKLCIPVPPQEEQERIVERINGLLSTIEMRG